MSTECQDPQHDPQHQICHVAKMLDTVISHVQGNAAKLGDPRAEALFEAAADELIGLKTAFEEFDGGWNSQADIEFNPGVESRPVDLPNAKPRAREIEVRADDGESQNPPAEAAHARATPPAPELAGFDE